MVSYTLLSISLNVKNIGNKVQWYYIGIALCFLFNSIWREFEGYHINSILNMLLKGLDSEKCDLNVVSFGFFYKKKL